LKNLFGFKVNYVAEGVPNRTQGVSRFVLGLLQAGVTTDNIKLLFRFLNDRLRDKPIVIKAKFSDGRIFDISASSRAELDEARKTLEAMARIK
jgi:hypothetical protein